ncbi:MAG: SOS response-associated peptidase [Streptosporangiales bacterium]|nr:SOS response-associated peptidase [Streptosporangiales bacterium]MBO0890492.1 SOS response-associated peptidase [Acidothermales bacterium]
MCGRYASMRSADDLLAEFDVDELAVEEALPPAYNIAPTDTVYAVLERPARPAVPERDLPARTVPARQLRTVRWGLVPSWSPDAGSGPPMINARIETVAEKPAFRTAITRRRCLVPADGYFEWYADGTRKVPHFIRREDGGLLAFAGLYEIWRDPRRRDDEDDAWLWSCTIVTTTATDDLGHVHDRMPMVVPAAARALWLDTLMTDADAARRLPVPAGDQGLTAYAVSKDVGDVRNNAPYLVEPAVGGEPDDVPTLF